MRPLCLIYLSTSTRVRTGHHYLFSLLVSLSVCVGATFVVFTDGESCTSSISTNAGSIQTGEYGLTRGKCSITRRLEVVAVAGLLRISWSVLGAAGFRTSFLLRSSKNAHGLLQV